MKRNTFILKCFLQLTCSSLDGSQKEGDNFLNLFQKEEGSQKGGFPQKRGVQTNIWNKKQEASYEFLGHLKTFWVLSDRIL